MLEKRVPLSTLFPDKAMQNSHVFFRLFHFFQSCRTSLGLPVLGILSCQAITLGIIHFVHNSAVSKDAGSLICDVYFSAPFHPQRTVPTTSSLSWPYVRINAMEPFVLRVNAPMPVYHLKIHKTA